MKDSLDLELSTRSEAAAQAYVRAVDAQLHGWTGALDALAQALQHDADFALAQAMQALLWQGLGRIAEARAAIACAQQLAASATAREQAHVGLLAHLIAGRPTQALQAVMQHAQQWPRDALALSTALGAFGLLAFSGRADHDAARLQLVQSLLPHYPADHPWLISQLSWAHTEAGDTDTGLALAQRSLHLRRANANAAHVRLHAHFERAETAQGLAFIDDWLPLCPQQSVLYGHLNWHAALCQIELGQVDGALGRLVQVIQPHLAHTLPLVGSTDVASLLWRLGLAGRAGLHWDTAMAYVQSKYPQGGNAFVELHLALLATARRDSAALTQGHQRMQASAATGHGGGASAVQAIEALQAWLDGDASGAAQAFAACLAQAARLGGSHAQRTVLDLSAAAQQTGATAPRAD